MFCTKRPSLLWYRYRRTVGTRAARHSKTHTDRSAFLSVSYFMLTGETVRKTVLCTSSSVTVLALHDRWFECRYTIANTDRARAASATPFVYTLRAIRTRSNAFGLYRLITTDCNGDALTGAVASFGNASGVDSMPEPEVIVVSDATRKNWVPDTKRFSFSFTHVRVRMCVRYDRRDRSVVRFFFRRSTQTYIIKICVARRGEQLKYKSFTLCAQLLCLH